MILSLCFPTVCRSDVTIAYCTLIKESSISILKGDYTNWLYKKPKSLGYWLRYCGCDELPNDYFILKPTKISCYKRERSFSFSLKRHKGIGYCIIALLFWPPTHLWVYEQCRVQCRRFVDVAPSRFSVPHNLSCCYII